MKKRTLFLQLFIPYLAIIILVLIIGTIYSTLFISNFYNNLMSEELEIQAKLINDQMLEIKNVDSLCKQIGKISGRRVTVILPDGKVIGDSLEDPSTMDNHADRTEFIDALDIGIGKEIRYSYTIKEDFLYVAIPVKHSGEVVFVLRLSMSFARIHPLLRVLWLRIIFGGLLISVFAAFVSLFIFKRLKRKIETLRTGTNRFRQGDASLRLCVEDPLEIANLADSINSMGYQLNEQIKTITRQKSEQEAILSSMIEGVIAIDSKEHVLSIYKAASEMLGIDGESAKGKSIQEVIRNLSLQKFVQLTLSKSTPVEDFITIHQDSIERHIQANGAVFRDGSGKVIGAVIVLNDITHLKRLENIRKDFVANVSHELRTPITSIKGFVETLSDGAIKNPDDAKHFLSIISSQVDRLGNIIEDLLTLSKIEQETEKSIIPIEISDLKPVIENAVKDVALKAEEKSINIEINCDDGIRAKINSALLEQALVNLLDNAIKYSETEGVIKIIIENSLNEIRIHVKDSGPGIEEQHLSRLFERFYRIDKGRSRKLGGTGLGLAIVKHIMIAQGGQVTVQSKVGYGSIFTLHIPRI